MLAGGLVPAAAIAWRAATGGLGANPISQALNQLGLVALVFLVASLACTPVKALAGWTWPIRLRRLLGLLAFFYALLHVLTWSVLDLGLDVHAIAADLSERPFIIAGMAAFVPLALLAATSTDGAVRRMGFRAWKRLHRLAYAAAALGVLHFVWRVKKDLSEPALYGIVLAALLAVRLAAAAGRRRGRSPASVPAPRA